MHKSMTDLSRLFREFVSVCLGNYGGIALSLAINVILTRRLGAEGFGHLALLLTASQILSFFIANWSVQAVVRFGAQEFIAEGQVAKTIWARTGVLLPWLVLAVALLVIFRDWAADYLRVPLWGLALVGAHFVLSNLLTTMGALFQACQRMTQYAMTLFLDKLLTCAALLAVPAELARDPLIALGCYVAGTATVSAWALYAFGFRLFGPLRVDRATLSAVTQFSLPLIATTWVSLLGTYWIDYIVITKFLPLSDLGVYSLANQMAGVVQQVTIISSSVLLAHFSVMVAKREDAAIRELVSHVIPYGFLALSLLLGLFILHAGPIMPLVFGKEFSGSVMPLAILMIATSLMGFSNTFTPLLTAQGATWTLVWITLPTALVRVVMDVLLVPWMGINGAAVSTVLAYAISAFLVLVVVEQRLGMPVARNSLLGLPVLGVVFCSLFLQGLPLYVTGLLVLGGSAYLLARMFGLWGTEEPDCLSA